MNNPDTTLPKDPKVKEYIALISQGGTGQPVPLILINTLGEVPTWQRESAGQYYIDATDKFTINKTTIQITQTSPNGIVLVRSFGLDLPQRIYIRSVNFAGTYTDGIIDNMPLIIRVYTN